MITTKLNIKNFKDADRIIDFLQAFKTTTGQNDKNIDECVAKLYLGLRELEALGLIGVPFPSFCNIPVHAVQQRSYLKLESISNG